MQVLADVIGMPINVIATREACALGVAMCAAVVAGVYPTLQDAQKNMNLKISAVYKPNDRNHNHYCKEYKKYLALEAVKEMIQ